MLACFFFLQFHLLFFIFGSIKHCRKGIDLLISAACLCLLLFGHFNCYEIIGNVLFKNLKKNAFILLFYLPKFHPQLDRPCPLGKWLSSYET